MLKKKADEPKPVMTTPCTEPFLPGNQRPPVMNGI
jgi:hypothetical protein